jgi:hypothetical protein
VSALLVDYVLGIVDIVAEFRDPSGILCVLLGIIPCGVIDAINLVITTGGMS